ncbi:hypothetical protein EDD11_009602 [Mortierella claussenii]|nr:hypothetical protein EDD11_009602 [Mortierella claussenii]
MSKGSTGNNDSSRNSHINGGTEGRSRNQSPQSAAGAHVTNNNATVAPPLPPASLHSSAHDRPFPPPPSPPTGAAAATGPPPPVVVASSSQIVSQKTVEALGDWLLESASVQSLPAGQEQRRKQSFKSNALIDKTMKQSQEERRKQALAEQAKKRYQFTNHARKLALFASGQPSEGSSESEDADSQNEDDDDNDDQEDEEDLEQQDVAHSTDKKKKKSRSSKRNSASDPGNNAQGLISPLLTKSTTAHKRRLSSGSESESASRRKTDRTGDVLSPKKPRLQPKNSPKVARKRRERNPFRDQLMIPEAMHDIPTDLDTSYYIVPLPIGHRCFIISADGKTTARLPSGQLLVSAFESSLPAGSGQYRGNRRSDYCILDCVYSSVTRTFWTLDIMCWRGHPVYECETEFRFWWLRGKLAEIEELQTKWMASQTREWEQDAAKKKQKRARQIKRRQERAAAAAMDVVPTEPSDTTAHHEDDDGDDEAGTEGMDVEENPSKIGAAADGIGASAKKFWPVVFTPLPYFNASIDLVRLLAESMHQPTLSPSLTASPGTRDLAASSKLATSLTAPFASTSASTSTFSSTSHLSNKEGIKSSHHLEVKHQNGVSAPSLLTTNTLGTMALSGEIATAAALFPAHDKVQKLRQDQTLLHERAAGLVFFNKKTMYVLGTTPLCGWVSMEQIGDVFFGEEGGIGPVPGTSAVEGREVEMEDALERIRI